MFQGAPAQALTDDTSTEHPSTSDLLTVPEVARLARRSPWWIREQARRGLVDHYREGVAPPAGRRDVRPIVFTEAQAAAVVERARGVELRRAEQESA